MSIGTNCLNTTDYSTTVGYSAQSALGATSLGYSAKASGTFVVEIGYNAKTSSGILIGGQCNNTTANSIKFWVGNYSTTSTLAGVQFRNIIFGISDSNLTITNATGFDIQPTLANGLPAPTNNNDIVTKEYVDNLIPDLTYYLTADTVYIPPETLPIDVSGITGHNPDDDKLVTKKYVDDLFSSLSNS
jgi:hypothetical protein